MGREINQWLRVWCEIRLGFFFRNDPIELVPVRLEVLDVPELEANIFSVGTLGIRWVRLVQHLDEQNKTSDRFRSFTKLGLIHVDL